MHSFTPLNYLFTCLQTPIIMGLLSSLFGLFSSGSLSKEAAAYNNALMTIINSNDIHINDMNIAMISKNYSKAQEVRAQWEEAIAENIEAVDHLGAYNGDTALQQSVLKGLNGYKKIVTSDYPQLIAIRSSGKDDDRTESILLDNINDAFEYMANGVNEASTAFEERYSS